MTVLAAHALSKTYGATKALDNVDFRLEPGEIRGLVGGNGSGKSTFIKILAGVERPDSGGQITLPSGTVAEHGITPAVARLAGFRFVHQDVAIIDDLTVAENLRLGDGYPTNRAGLIRWREVQKSARETIERFGIDVRPGDLCKALPALTRTKLAVARALRDINASQPGVLVFDEATTSMSNRDSATFLDWLRGLSKGGQAVIFVSHRLDEVLALAETVTVFRDGRHVGTVPQTDLDERRLVEMMIGRELSGASGGHAEADSRRSSCRIELRRLSAGPLKGIDLRIGAGEIVGVAGLLGSGRTSLLRSIFGDLPLRDGSILLDGEPFAPRSITHAIGAGIAYVPENRLAEGVFPDLSVSDNVTAAAVNTFSSNGLLHTRTERRAADQLIADFRIRCGSSRHEVSTLSGGNQQKVILARWLGRKPRILLLDEPSQGVDVLARRDIQEFIRKGASGGMSVLVVTSDFNELARVADRVVVLRHGTVAAEIQQAQLTEDRITELTYGLAGMPDAQA